MKTTGEGHPRPRNGKTADDRKPVGERTRGGRQNKDKK